MKARQRDPARRSGRPTHLLLALLPALIATSFGAAAATRSYIGPDNGSWSAAANWSGSLPPVAGDDLFLGTQAPLPSTVDLHVNFNLAMLASNPYHSVTLNSTALNGTMFVNQTSAASVLYSDVLNIGSTVLGNTYNQSAGFNYSGQINLGVGAASTANAYNLSGGEIHSTGIAVGVHGSGSVTQTGGSVFVDLINGEIDVGRSSGSHGVYNLSGGVLSANVWVGPAGNGTFNQTGGSVGYAGFLVGGGSSGGTGVYNLSGGTVSAYVQATLNGTVNLKPGSTVGGSTTVEIDPGGLLNHQGGSFAIAPALVLSGGFARLNGHNFAVAQIDGSGGIIESAGGNAVLTIAGGNSATAANFGGVIRDGAASILSLTKSGAQKQTLSGANTYTGATQVLAGTLAVGSSTAFTGTGALVINGGIFDTTIRTATFTSLSGSGGALYINDPNSFFYTGSNNASTTYSGWMSGSGYFGKTGTGQLTLSGGGSFSGFLDIFEGSLRIGAFNGLSLDTYLSLHASTQLLVSFSQIVSHLDADPNTVVNFSGNSEFTVGSGNDSSGIHGLLVGTGTFIKEGTGTYTLGDGDTDTANVNVSTGLAMVVNAGTLALDKASGSNAAGGAMTLNGGVLKQLRGNQISDTSFITLAGGTWQLQGSSETIGGLAGNAGLIDLAGGALTVTQAGTSTYAGALHGPGSFVKSGSGDLTMTGAAGYSGNWFVNAGHLILSGATGGSGYSATSGGILRFDLAGVALGGGSITAALGGAVEYKNSNIANGFLRGGTHTMLAGSSNTFNAVTTFNSTQLLQNGPTGFSNFSNGGHLTNNAPATLNGATNSSSGVIDVNSNLATVDFSSNGVITVANGGNLNNAAGNLVLGGGSRTTVNAGGTLATAAGTAIELNGGLLVNNGIVSGQTHVNYGSTAKGSGVFGAVSVSDGGVFSPGNSPGLATVNGFTLGAGSSYVFEVNDFAGAPGVGYDSVDNLGLLTVTSGNTAATRAVIVLNTLTLQNTPGAALNWNAAVAHDFVLMRSSAGITGYDPLAWIVDSSSFVNALDGGAFSVQALGNDLVLHFAPVPEPAVAWLLTAGLSLMAYRQRRTGARSS